MTHRGAAADAEADRTLLRGDMCVFKRQVCSRVRQDYAYCVFEPSFKRQKLAAPPCRALRDLQETKSAIDSIDIQAWRHNNNQTLLAKDVPRHLQSEVHAEMPTKAFCKMYEILCEYESALQLGVHSKSVTSVHLCEAPGAFVSATNHFLRSRYPAVLWDWVASTLADSQIGDDYSLLHHTPSHWNFGADHSGDIRSIDNIEQLWRDCAARFGHGAGANLVTADGSVDCSGDPNDQESTVAWLHMCEVVAALGLLAHGGMFVLKMFTLFEDTSVDILYLLSCFFATVEVCKPITSAPGNSETYVVCTGFGGATASQLQSLSSSVRAHAPVTSTVPETFASRVRQIAEYFAVLQTRSISRNLSIFSRFSNLSRDYPAMRVLEEKCVETTRRWRFRYPITAIDSELRLMPTQPVTARGPRRGPSALARYTVDRRQTRGTLHERRDNAASSVPQPLEFEPHIRRMLQPRSASAASRDTPSAGPRPPPHNTHNSHGLGYAPTRQFSSKPVAHPHHHAHPSRGLHGFVKAEPQL